MEEGVLRPNMANHESIGDFSTTSEPGDDVAIQVEPGLEGKPLFQTPLPEQKQLSLMPESL